MALAVGHYLSHMTKIILIVAGWILLGILLQDLNDLPSAANVGEMV